MPEKDPDAMRFPKQEAHRGFIADSLSAIKLIKDGDPRAMAVLAAIAGVTALAFALAPATS